MDMLREYSHVSCVSTVGRFIHIHPWHLGLCLEGTPLSQYNKCIHYMHTLISDLIVFYVYIYLQTAQVGPLLPIYML